MKIAVGKSAVRLCCHLRWGLLFGVAEGAKGCLSATTSCFGLFARALVVCPGTLLSKIRAACAHVPSGVYWQESGAARGAGDHQALRSAIRNPDEVAVLVAESCRPGPKQALVCLNTSRLNTRCGTQSQIAACLTGLAASQRLATDGHEASYVHVAHLKCCRGRGLSAATLMWVVDLGTQDLHRPVPDMMSWMPDWFFNTRYQSSDSVQQHDMTGDRMTRSGMNFPTTTSPTKRTYAFWHQQMHCKHVSVYFKWPEPASLCFKPSPPSNAVPVWKSQEKKPVADEKLRAQHMLSGT